MNPIDTVYIESPLGILEITGSNGVVFSVLFTDDQQKASLKIPASLKECVNQLRDYFSGKRKKFDLQLQPNGTTFQRHVWDELLRIEFGKTISYLQLARNLGDEKSIRAAASANGKNPIGIVIPCHRVIGSNSELVGYAGGLWRKQWLLDLENGQQSLDL
ncbi:MAG: methylated-DNA--[protein]-cysteine S-methyltransferase [Bacteroidota bacterium]